MVDRLVVPSLVLEVRTADGALEVFVASFEETVGNSKEVLGNLVVVV